MISFLFLFVTNFLHFFPANDSDKFKWHTILKINFVSKSSILTKSYLQTYIFEFLRQKIFQRPGLKNSYLQLCNF